MLLILTALAIGALYASLLYLFSKKYGKALSVMLFSFRTIVVATIVMLFINPYIKQKSYKIEKPVVIIAQDNSESIILTKDSVFYKEKYPSLLDSITDALEKNYEVETVLFGSDADFSTLILDRNDIFNEQYTNISNVLNSLRRQYFKKNVGAVVLLSDGIVNQGVNPEMNIESYPFPIYSVTLGDTVSYPSITIKDVKYNKTVQANMLFPLRVTVNARSYKGNDIQVTVMMDGNEVENVVVPVRSERFSKTLDFNIDSGNEGTKQIDIIVKTQGSVSRQRRVFINVTDKKYRVICLAHAPHPDIAAIRLALDNHFDFEVRYNRNIDDINDFDLLVLHQLSIKSPVPTLRIIGSGNDFNEFNTSQDMVKASPGAANTGLDIRARYNNGFGLFTIHSDIKNEIQSYPPLSMPHLEMSFATHHDELFFMNVMDYETPLPLLVFSHDADGNKMAFLFGTGCWRWKLYEYYHHKNTEGFNEIISKTVKYLLTEKDKELTINHKDSYLNTENIDFSAELRNPSRELINEPDLHITIYSKDSKESYDYIFSKGDNNYNLNIGMLSEGIYSYNAHTSLGGIEYNAEGSFTVESVGLEAQELTANSERMRSLASQTGGRHYYITDIKHIIKDLGNDERITTVSREETRYNDLINIKWLFFSILGLITIEWILRKIFGIY